MNFDRGYISPYFISNAERMETVIDDPFILITDRKISAVADLGRARRVVANKDETTIIEGKGAEDVIQARMKSIKAQIDETTSDYDREKLQERLAKLTGGVAVIKVGAATEVELKEKKHRVEDALSATRAAVEEGIVPGGGVAFIKSLAALNKIAATGDEATGVAIVRRALEEPLRMIAINAGQEGSVVVDAIKKSKDKYHGYDALRNEFGDMVKKGIIDPTKVTRAALYCTGSNPRGFPGGFTPWAGVKGGAPLLDKSPKGFP